MLFRSGIYEETPAGRHFCILTTAANASMEPVHDRMPVVLHEDEMRIWLLDPAQAMRLLHAPGKMLERTALDGQLALW